MNTTPLSGFKNRLRQDIEKARALSKKMRPSRAWTRMTPAKLPVLGAQTYSNGLYTANVRRFEQGWPLGGGPWASIGIFCEDGEARHDWRDFQRIKNDLVGPAWEAIELYPSEARLMDPSNYFILWCAPEIKVGKYEGRKILHPEHCLAPQRPWGTGVQPEEGFDRALQTSDV